MNVKKIAVEIIKRNLGSETAMLYEKFYLDKEDRVVIESVKELISDFIGPEKANQELEIIMKK